MKRLTALLSAISLVVAFTGCSSSHGGGTASPTVPGAPAQLTATSGNGQVSLSWSAVSGATSYNVYYSTTSGVTPGSGTKVSGLTVTSYSVTGLTNGTTYYFVVTAVNAAGESPASSQASAPADETLPVAPQSLVATAGNAQVALSWAASSTATSYNLYYSTTTGVTPANGTKVSGLTSTSYTETSLTNGTTYYFIVTAVNQGGESGASNQVSATPAGPSLGTPSSLTATPGSAQVSLSWAGASGASSYNVYYSTTAGVTPANGTKISGVSGTSTVVPNLTGCVTYYFVVTAVAGSSESTASNQAVATANGTVSVTLTPGTAGSVTLAANASTSLTFNFPANAVTQSTTVNLAPLTQAQLPVALATSKGTYLGAYQMCFSPSSVTTLSAPATITGTVASSYASGTSLNLAEDQSNAWTDVATFIVGNSSALNENLATPSLPGVLGPGAYLLYQPAAGANTSISNLGVVLVPDDGTLYPQYGIQFVYFFTPTGAVSTTPTLQFLPYTNAGDLDGAALTPEGGQGVVVDGGNNVYFFTGLLTGNLVSSSTVLNISNYGGDGDSIVIFPNGDEAVATGDGDGQLVYITGILSGTPVIAATIPFSSAFSNDGLILARDGSWLMARGIANPGLTLYSISSISPTPGALAGTVSHSFTPQNVSGTILTPFLEDGRDEMAISPTDTSRAVVAGHTSSYAAEVQLITGLPLSATAGAGVAVPAPCTAAYSVAVSLDGTFAVVGCDKGLVLYTGVNSGTLTQVGSVYAPTYTNPCQPNSAFATPCTSSTTVTLGSSSGTLSLAFTLDGKYLAVTDSYNEAVVLIPVTASGFGAVASVRGNIGTPSNDQIIAH
jgi:fibronectin type 3 domain-containing protein